MVAATAKSRVNSPATGAPTVSGTPAIRTELTADVSGIADADGLTNVSYRYQWFSNDGTGDVDIGILYAENDDIVRGWSGQNGTEDHLWLGRIRLGETIGVRVTFLDDAGNWEILTSSPTPPVGPLKNSPATGKPTIEGHRSGRRDVDGGRLRHTGRQWVQAPRLDRRSRSPSGPWDGGSTTSGFAMTVPPIRTLPVRFAPITI